MTVAELIEQLQALPQDLPVKMRLDSQLMTGIPHDVGLAFPRTSSIPGWEDHVLIENVKEARNPW